MMTFNEAVSDPRRPLSLTPREWMYAVEAELAQENDLVDKTVSRIATAQDTPPEDSGTGIEKIDMGIDMMVEAVKLMNSGILDANMADLDPKVRTAVEKIRDLLETAIEPYLMDIVKLSDSMDE